MTTYHGNCHCGRYRFDLSIPLIKSAISCTCSLCKKKGSLWLIPPAESFQVVRDDGNLTEYLTNTIRDKVCCNRSVLREYLLTYLSSALSAARKCLASI